MRVAEVHEVAADQAVRHTRRDGYPAAGKVDLKLERSVHTMTLYSV